MTDAPLKLFNSLTRTLEVFEPVYPGEARVYTCGPTVYNYPHIGNMRAYVFADVLGRTLSWKGYTLTHVINITDVGHLTDDADAGEDKMEKMAAEKAQSIEEIARHYTKAYLADVRALNIRGPAKDGKPTDENWTYATKYVPQMIEFAERIEAKHCYELDSGLYFDVSTVADYGRLASDDELWEPYRHFSSALKAGGDTNYFQSAIAKFLYEVRRSQEVRPSRRSSRLIELLAPLEAASPSDFSQMFIETAPKVGEVFNSGRIEAVEGKRNAADFAIWRKTPPGEKRQMEWPSKWGMGAPGWHLECSVMSGEVLGFPFDIHTGGIDHREIHHPNEIAQNQAYCCTSGLDDPKNSGAKIWMHNNFLVERRKESAAGKMSKSSGEFLRLQLLIDKGYHPLAYRLMCLQAHYRSELEFSWEGLQAALTRLKRIAQTLEKLRAKTAFRFVQIEKMQLGIEGLRDTLAPHVRQFYLSDFERSLSEDLKTPEALRIFEAAIQNQRVSLRDRVRLALIMDEILGLNVEKLSRKSLRIRPKSDHQYSLQNNEVDSLIHARRILKKLRQFEASDSIRDLLIADGVNIMDGDPLGWEWKLA